VVCPDSALMIRQSTIMSVMEPQVSQGPVHYPQILMGVSICTLVPIWIRLPPWLMAVGPASSSLTYVACS